MIQLSESVHQDNYRVYNTTIENLNKKLAAAQAKIDALMLEYCPDEMTQEQIDNWVRHQRVVKVGEIK